jgi:hypothetical protein
MGLSRRAYAALRGVHESAVHKAIAAGPIRIGAQFRSAPLMAVSDAQIARTLLPSQP